MPIYDSTSFAKCFLSSIYYRIDRLYFNRAEKTLTRASLAPVKYVTQFAREHALSASLQRPYDRVYRGYVGIGP